MLIQTSFNTRELLCLGTLMFSGVVTEKCITCKRNTLEECTVGTEAATFEGHRQQCSDSLPFCEVTVQEGLRSEDSDAEPEVRDVSRGCIQESRFTCNTVEDVRTCTATCQGNLCNNFEDVAARVQEYEREQEEEAARRRQEQEEEAARRTPAWVIPVAVVVPLAALAAVVLGIYGVRNNRRKARELNMSGEADTPLRKDG